MKCKESDEGKKSNKEARGVKMPQRAEHDEVIDEAKYLKKRNETE